MVPTDSHVQVPELSRRVKLILSQSRSREFYREVARIDPAIVALFGRGGTSKAALAKAIDVAPAGAFELVHEQVLLLRRLYASLPSDLQKSLPDVLVNGLNASSAQVVAHALLEFGSVEWILNIALNDLKLLYEVSRALVDKLRYEATLFSDTDLMIVKRFADIHFDGGSRIAQMTVDAAPLGRMPHVDADMGQQLVDISKQVRHLVNRIAYLRLGDELRES
jgi:hypothetical protein